MSSFPSNLCRIIVDGFGETFDRSVNRTEMERGVPKQSIVNTSVLVTISVTLIFDSLDDVDAFHDWYFNTINRIGWFDLRHPRTHNKVTARFSDNFGPITPIGAGWVGGASCTATLEYLR